MEMISLILSGLALLAACACLVIQHREKKRSDKQRAALRDYVDRVCEDLNNRMEACEKGIVPDYEQAKEAANAVNDFNKGIANILGFDPVRAMQAERERERAGGEVSR